MVAPFGGVRWAGGQRMQWREGNIVEERRAGGVACVGLTDRGHEGGRGKSPREEGRMEEGKKRN